MFNNYIDYRERESLINWMVVFHHPISFTFITCRSCKTEMEMDILYNMLYYTILFYIIIYYTILQASITTIVQQFQSDQDRMFLQDMARKDERAED